MLFVKDNAKYFAVFHSEKWLPDLTIFDRFSFQNVCFFFQFFCNQLNLLCVLCFGFPKRYPFFYKGRTDRQTGMAIPTCLGTTKFTLLKSCYLFFLFSNSSVIRPFPTNFISSLSCPQPAVANKKKVGWSWNSLLPAYPPLPLLAFSFFCLGVVPLGPFFGFKLACSSGRCWDQSSQANFFLLFLIFFFSLSLLHLKATVGSPTVP